MSTGQMYVGRERSANPTEQTAENSPQTANIEAKQFQSLDWAQSQLLSLVDDYLSQGFASEPIEAINDLLFRWLTLPTTQLDLDYNRNQLHRAFQLVNFLSTAYEMNVRLQSLTDEKEKEVSNG